MEFFGQTHIDFMKQSKWATLFSAILGITAIIFLAINGLNLGLDFTGGIQATLRFPKAIQLDQVRTQLSRQHIDKASIQLYGDSQTVLIRLSTQKQSIEAVKQLLHKALPKAERQQIEFIGPQVGKKMILHSILAVLISLIATMLYIALRFDYRFAFSATIALIHDPVVILGLFAVTQLEFNLIGLAALLTVLGYSLNDTIVVYDRIRENFRKMPNSIPKTVLNHAINDTLSRTIMTSALTLLVVIALIIWGGPVLEGFSWALLAGILIGTYSSIYIAGALALKLGLDRHSCVKQPIKHRT